ncbi:hypothetical protein SH601_07385 [Gracilibacillus sp. S3-1-1]|uniref:Uncharacterized protein n=1 Tax=Gracilibacillus pellucidus TaxID=3095368 RepID=A0ACC6M4H0_9BACI|nr:hypothetical protein [Gracilibacillus sp. S3-1-1]MDX8045811.1 hypothetical protein [Gracilibacillus sp. S3-1-1]
MGYIIPVEHYQYQQYHNRVQRSTQDPFPIERLYPIQLGMHDRKMKTKESFKKRKMTSSIKSQPSELVVHDTAYAGVTGKGKHFEASV